MSLLNFIGRTALSYPRASILGIGAAIGIGSSFAASRINPDRSLMVDQPDQMKGFGSNTYDFIKGTLGDNAVLNLGLGIGLDIYSNKIAKKSLISIAKKGRLLGPESRRVIQNLFKSRSLDTKITNTLSYMVKNPKLVTEAGLGKSAYILQKATKLRGLAKGIGWLGMGLMAFDAVSSLFEMPKPIRMVSSAQRASFGGTFYDTDEAYTQRRRALNAIHNSQFGGRSAYGNEASLMHM